MACCRCGVHAPSFRCGHFHAFRPSQRSQLRKPGEAALRRTTRSGGNEYDTMPGRPCRRSGHRAHSCRGGRSYDSFRRRHESQRTWQENGECIGSRSGQPVTKLSHYRPTFTEPRGPERRSADLTPRQPHPQAPISDCEAAVRRFGLVDRQARSAPPRVSSPERVRVPTNLTLVSSRGHRADAVIRARSHSFAKSALHASVQRRPLVTGRWDSQAENSPRGSVPNATFKLAVTCCERGAGVLRGGFD